MKRNTIFLLIILLIGIKVFGQIEINESFSDKIALKDFRLIVIDPSYKIFSPGNPEINHYDDQLKYQKDYIAMLKKFSKKNKINVEFIFNDHEKYWSDILALKNSIYLSNITQNHPLDQKKSYSMSFSYSKSILINPPTLDGAYSALSKTFNTPYFAICEWISVKDASYNDDVYSDILFAKKNSVFYLIIVDVITGEVIYRDIRNYSFSGRTPDMYPVIHEIFYLLNKNLNK